MTRKAEYGFTLLELLVVIAIMALLVTLMAPSLSGMRETARTVQCAANLHEIGKAYGLRKVQEARARMKPMLVYGWATTLRPYTDNTSKVFYCPQGPAEEDADPTAIDLTEYYQDTGHEGSGGFIHLPDIDTLQVEDYAHRADWSLWWWLKERDNNGFVLGLEDQAQNGGYQDIVYRFEYLGESLKVTYVLNQSCWRHYLRAPGGEVILGPMGGGAGGEQIPYGTSAIIPGGAARTNYGMNSLAPITYGGKDVVLVLDYDKSVAKCADPNIDEDFFEHVAPRHRDKCNVLFTGGGVRLMDPADVEPSTSYGPAKWQP